MFIPPYLKQVGKLVFVGGECRFNQFGINPLSLFLPHSEQPLKDTMRKYCWERHSMTLDAGQVDSSYLLEKMNLPVATEKRLESLGMTRGTEIHVLNNKDRGTMIVKVRGTRFAIGREISRNIQTLPALPRIQGQKAVS